MGRVMFGVATLFFFLAAVGSSLVPNPTAWGFVLVALGLCVGSWSPWPARRPSP